MHSLNREARMAGIILKEYNFHFDVVYTSLLRRSTKTVWIVMQELGLEWVNVVKDWRLNERNYGTISVTQSLTFLLTYSFIHSFIYRCISG
jgi:bisphosphoglycerate-dependent phosphoglycerate mutase